MPLEGKPNSAQMSSIDQKPAPRPPVAGRGRLWLAAGACRWPPVAGRWRLASLDGTEPGVLGP
eukprot:2303610-Lingulodinium_polyedra.AAC.1